VGLLLAGFATGGLWCFPRWQPITEEDFERLKEGMTQEEVLALLGRKPNAKGEWFAMRPLVEGDPVYWFWSEASHRVYYRDDHDRMVDELLNTALEEPVIGDMMLDGNVIGVSFNDKGRVSGMAFCKAARPTWRQKLQTWLYSQGLAKSAHQDLGELRFFVRSGE
jgi:hypothetical protein